jgi:hypothetical protein
MFMLRKVIKVSLAVILMLTMLPNHQPDSSAAPVRGNAQFWVWARTDMPVADFGVNRTWMWGPEAMTGMFVEPYVQAPGGDRIIQYFDKSRMEVTYPAGNPSDPWYVTNGLLAQELITGRMQLGDATFEQRSPANVNVAGDGNDPNGPTYQTFSSLLDHQPFPINSTIIQTVDRAGNVSSNSGLASHGVTAAHHVSATNHTVASVFWEFMNSRGTVYDYWGNLTNDRLFLSPFYATGLPLTEAYWTNVLVAGQSRQVLVQVFERRVLTFTPGNPQGWQVEAGNVGRHYYRWRYGDMILPGEEWQQYSTDFTNWLRTSFPQGSTSMAANGYRVRVDGPGDASLGMQTHGQHFGDAVFNLGMRKVSPGSESAGCLVVRLGSVGNSGYNLCLDGQGRSYAGYGDSTNDTYQAQTVLLNPAVRPGNRPLSEVNHLSIVAYGNDIWFQVNGHLIGSVRHTGGPLIGEAGVRVLKTGQNPAEWEFQYMETRNVVP